jgi:hypothetical protein
MRTCVLRATVMRSICKAVPIVTICLFLLFARSPGHPVDEIHVHGGFLAEEDDPTVDVDVCAVPASVSRKEIRPESIPNRRRRAEGLYRRQYLSTPLRASKIATL